MSSTLLPGIYIVATPIGNLGDISARARSVLEGAQLVACEDTRVTGKLLSLLGIKARLLRHDDHSDASVRARIIDAARTAVVALVCDAGTPLISDPGYRLVRDAREAGVAVTSIPGPCAAVTALTLAALPTDRFLFAGFLPPKTMARQRELAELAPLRATLVFYESGPRLGASLADMLQMLGDRPACVARELTKLHEEVRTDTLGALAETYAQHSVKGEIVIVVGPPVQAAPATIDDSAIDEALRTALATASTAQAAKQVAKALGVPRETVYARAVALAAAS